MSRRGFTLMEMLVALGMFAIIGIMASQLLRQTIDVSDSLLLRGDRLVEIQRAMSLMSRDFHQIVGRSVRDEFGDSVGYVNLDTFGVFSATRTGWSNLLNRPRSTLQRVEYFYNTGNLIRRYWPVLDRTEMSQPIDQELLLDVEDIEFAIIDNSGNEHLVWPPEEGAVDQTTGDASRPIGIQLTMTIDPIGDVRRIWGILEPPTVIEIRERQGGPGTGGPGSPFVLSPGATSGATL